MNNKNILDRIALGISELKGEEKVKELIKEALSADIPPIEIVEKGIREGLNVVGDKYEKGEYFLSELMVAGDVVEESLEFIEPKLKEDETEEKGTIIIGTVKDDIHNIGKNIFANLAKAEGFNVVDLGVDVKPEEFLKEAKDQNADIIGMSCLLTTTLERINETIDLLEEDDLSKNVKFLIGGNAVNNKVANKTGADAAALQAVNGIEICKEWMEKKE